MATEVLEIHNFVGIKSAKIELARINVFIGPQASGKSVCAKLFFFFKDSIKNLENHILDGKTKTQIRKLQQNNFFKYFPVVNWGTGGFIIRYAYGDLWMEVKRKHQNISTIEINYSDYYSTVLMEIKNKIKSVVFGESIQYPLQFSSIEALGSDQTLTNSNYFIPSGRCFFHIIQRQIFTLIARNIDIDPFLVQFGFLYEDTLVNRNSIKYVIYTKIDRHISNLISGKYERSRSKDYIVMDDDRKVEIENCSSGQQEALPLCLVLGRISLRHEGPTRSTLFVEEPETHLFPTAQREIVHLILEAIDLSSGTSSSQCLITTHSPYILSAINNLMYAGKISKEFPDKRSNVNKLLDEAIQIDPKNVRAYYVANGTAVSIIEPEIGLVESKQLDSVSDELATEFQNLVHIEFDVEAA